MAAPAWAVICDMDGVLLDSEPIQMAAFNAVLEPYGLSYSPESFCQFIGIRAIDNFRHIVTIHGLPCDPQDLNRQKAARYRQLLRVQAVPRPGIVALLDDLARCGVPLALASSSPRDDIALTLACLDMRSVFAAIVSGDEVVHGKPAPDIFLAAGQRLSTQVRQALPPGVCLVIEDNAVGIAAAGAAGMRCLAAPTALTRAQDFSAATCVVDSFVGVDACALAALVHDEQR